MPKKITCEACGKVNTVKDGTAVASCEMCGTFLPDETLAFGIGAPPAADDAVPLAPVVAPVVLRTGAKGEAARKPPAAAAPKKAAIPPAAAPKGAGKSGLPKIAELPAPAQEQEPEAPEAPLSLEGSDDVEAPAEVAGQVLCVRCMTLYPPDQLRKKGKDQICVSCLSELGLKSDAEAFKPKSKAGKVIAVLVVLLLAGGGTGGWFWWRMQPDPALTTAAKAAWERATAAVTANDPAAAVKALGEVADLAKRPRASVEVANLAWAARGRRDEIVAYGAACRAAISLVPAAPTATDPATPEGQVETHPGVDEVVAAAADAHAKRKESEGAGALAMLSDLAAALRRTRHSARSSPEGASSQHPSVALTRAVLAQLGTTRRFPNVPRGYVIQSLIPEVPAAPESEFTFAGANDGRDGGFVRFYRRAAGGQAVTYWIRYITVGGAHHAVAVVTRAH